MNHFGHNTCYCPQIGSGAGRRHTGPWPAWWTRPGWEARPRTCPPGLQLSGGLPRKRPWLPFSSASPSTARNESSRAAASLYLLWAGRTLFGERHQCHTLCTCRHEDSVIRTEAWLKPHPQHPCLHGWSKTDNWIDVKCFLVFKKWLTANVEYRKIFIHFANQIFSHTKENPPNGKAPGPFLTSDAHLPAITPDDAPFPPWTARPIPVQEPGHVHHALLVYERTGAPVSNRSKLDRPILKGISSLKEPIVLQKCIKEKCKINHNHPT